MHCAEVLMLPGPSAAAVAAQLPLPTLAAQLDLLAVVLPAAGAAKVLEGCC